MESSRIQVKSKAALEFHEKGGLWVGGREEEEEKAAVRRLLRRERERRGY